MNHYALCKLTAERFLKDSGNNIALYEYQSFVSGEFPDVLIYGQATTLYEIKMSRSDFLADSKKDSRVKYKTRYYIERDYRTGKMYSKAHKPEERWNEKPHLGLKRYYVCPWGIIKPKDLDTWGLYWYNEKNNRFYKKKESKIFVRNIHAELRLLSHAFRKYGNLHGEEVLNIMIKEY